MARSRLRLEGLVLVLHAAFFLEQSWNAEIELHVEEVHIVMR